MSGYMSISLTYIPSPVTTGTGYVNSLFLPPWDPPCACRYCPKDAKVTTEVCWDPLREADSRRSAPCLMYAVAVITRHSKTALSTCTGPSEPGEWSRDNGNPRSFINSNMAPDGRFRLLDKRAAAWCFSITHHNSTSCGRVWHFWEQTWERFPSDD